MKHNKLFLGILCLLVMTLAVTGCGDKDNGDDSSSKSFSYSEGLDNNGYWDGVTAKDSVQMGDYKGITIPKENHTVTDGAVQTEIDNILSENKTTKEVKDRAVKDGETVNIDYVGSINGKEFEGGSTGGEGTDITLGEAGYIDDFEDQIVGHKPGETFNVEVTFPNDYNQEDLQGKDAVFVTTVNFIVEEEKSELTDEFVKKNLKSSDGWSTVAQMKKGVKEDIKNRNIDSYITKYLGDNFTVSSVPENILEYQKDAFVEYYNSMAQSYGMEVKDMLSSMGVKTMDELVKKESASIENNAKLSLIVQAIAEDMDLQVSENDIKTSFSKNMGSNDYSNYEETYGLPYLKQNVLNEKVIEYIRENCKLA